MVVLKGLFWFSLSFIIYTYVGYPCLLWIWARLFPKEVKKGYASSVRGVSVIIAARNEECTIGKRLENILSQNYDPEGMEIIVVSDGSTDGTNDVVKEFINSTDNSSGRGNRVKLIEVLQHSGKPNTINIGVCEAAGEYVVFADARQEFEPNAVKELIANFNDSQVGCVSGELVFYENSETSISTEMGFYWSLEKRIRKMESTIHSVAGATGAIYAIRRSLYQPVPDGTLLDDVYVPMKVVFQGYRTVFDTKALAYDKMSKNLSQEKHRKVRTLLGNYQLLRIMPQLLSPIKNPVFFRYLSHKIFRLFVPFFFFGLLLSSFVSSGLFYHSIFILIMVSFVFLGFNGILSLVPYIGKVSKLIRTFYSLNYFALIAFCYFCRRGKKSVW